MAIHQVKPISSAYEKPDPRWGQKTMSHHKINRHRRKNNTRNRAIYLRRKYGGCFYKTRPRNDLFAKDLSSAGQRKQNS